MSPAFAGDGGGTGDESPPPITYHNEETMRRVIIERQFGSNRIPVGTEGYFHQWGSESNIEAGPDTVAVIELDDGKVVFAYPGQIRFLEPHAIAAKLAATPAGIARACGMENYVEAAQEARPFTASLGGAP